MWSSSLRLTHTPEATASSPTYRWRKPGSLAASASEPAASSNRRMRTIRRCRSSWTSLDSSVMVPPSLVVALCPAQRTAQQFVVRRLVPRAPFDAWVVIDDRDHVVVAPAVPEGVVQHRAGAERTQVHHQVLGVA